MSEIVISQIDLSNAHQAFPLLVRFFREEGFQMPTEMQNSFEAMVSSPNSAIYIAQRFDEALGIATVTSSISLEYGYVAEMDDLYVLPKERGNGIASILIDSVSSWCKAKGCTALLVTVTPAGQERHNLVSFYKRRGFQDYGRLILELKLDAG